MVINIQDDILRLHAMGLLSRLLADKATKGNILWATDAYAELGEWYSPGNEIRPQRITGDNSDLIKTRARRAMEQRTERTRQHAEVFTPLWVVKKMNDFADVQWFGRKDGIYKYTDDGRIYFSKQKHWKLYVDAKRMEITCGEAPFLATRYDVETGEAIPVEDRIGLLDRKLRVASENARDIDEWKERAFRAVQSIYGYELQGDNLLIARVNILCTVEEHMVKRWKQKPEKAWLEKLCNVIAWNLWQMDGIKGCVPVPPTPTEEQLSLFPPLREQANLFGETERSEISCRLFDWRADRSISYQTLREKGSKAMKFDFIIGNPPYQNELTGDSNTATPIYNCFMDASYDLSDKVMLISPARFLFNAGYTPKDWNKKMLNDAHLKVVSYFPDSSSVFRSVDIKGGVVITYRDLKKDFGAIQVFSPFKEANTILRKVITSKTFESLKNIIVTSFAYHFTNAMYEEHPELAGRASKGHDYDIQSNTFNVFPEIFYDSVPDSGDYIRILGREDNRRAWKYIKRKYVTQVSNLDSYKAFYAKATGTGQFGETLPDAIMGEPGDGATVTFLSIGSFKTNDEAKKCVEYTKTKFARTLLSILKVTQDNTPGKWQYVPLQDFTSASDIDWSKSIPEIDQQLYAKYGLDAEEIDFIETHVKPMT